MLCDNTKCSSNKVDCVCNQTSSDIQAHCSNQFKRKLIDCSTCSHHPVCKTAEALDGVIWECQYYDPNNKWIPATQPPEEDGCYIVAVENEHERRYSKTAWYTKQSNSWFARQRVTHWMPLPFAPNK